jgi:hypothetical protein
LNCGEYSPFGEILFQKYNVLSNIPFLKSPKSNSFAQSLSISDVTDSVEAFKLGLQRPPPSSVLFSLSPVFLHISSPVLSLFMCCFFLSSLCYHRSGVFFDFVSSEVFFYAAENDYASC